MAKKGKGRKEMKGEKGKRGKGRKGMKGEKCKREKGWKRGDRGNG